MRRRSGFTLIEMMIVLAIIAALAATLVPIAMNALNQAKVTGNLTDLESIRMAQMQYYYKNGNVASTADELANYLTWTNLQGTNVGGSSGYVFDTSSGAQAIITFDLGSEPLGRAFMAQWTNLGGTDESAEAYAVRSNDGEITVYYNFR